MRYKLSSLTKKFILGGILLLVGGFLLPLDTQAVELGGWIEKDTIRFYTDSFDRIRVFFRVNTTFEINYEGEGLCQTKDYQWYIPHWRIRGSNFDTGAGTYPHWAWFFQSLDFNNASTCEETSEVYEAGKSYDVFLADTQSNGLFWLDPNGFEAGNPIALLKDSPTCQNSYGCPYNETEFIRFHLNNVDYVDEFNWQPIPNLQIDYPVSSSELVSAFEMEITFNTKDIDFDRIMIIFESWHASTTCPIYGTEIWQQEYRQYFYFQSYPYFSNFLATSTGTTTIKVSDLNSGFYNCVRCHFINETIGTISEELCPLYTIEVVAYIPAPELPIYYLPIRSWADYYAEHSERFTTSTPLFTSWAGAIEPLITWTGNIVLFFQDFFDPDEAKEKGKNMGGAVSTARGYLENIDDFFGGLPLSTIFIFYLITTLVVIIYRLAKGILTIIIP